MAKTKIILASTLSVLAVGGVTTAAVVVTTKNKNKEKTKLELGNTGKQDKPGAGKQDQPADQPGAGKQEQPGAGKQDQPADQPGAGKQEQPGAGKQDQPADQPGAGKQEQPGAGKQDQPEDQPGDTKKQQLLQLIKTEYIKNGGYINYVFESNNEIFDKLKNSKNDLVFEIQHENGVPNKFSPTKYGNGEGLPVRLIKDLGNKKQFEVSPLYYFDANHKTPKGKYTLTSLYIKSENNINLLGNAKPIVEVKY